MALGGVPIGVAIPPILAATGILNVSAIRPFPFAGKAANTGVRNVSIMAAVAVLDTNIEKTPVISRKPSNTVSLLLPNGRMRLRARRTSRPDFVAAIASTKPPRNSMITGLAKVAMISVELSSAPKSAPSITSLLLYVLPFATHAARSAASFFRSSLPGVVKSHFLATSDLSSVTLSSSSIDFR